MAVSRNPLLSSSLCAIALACAAFLMLQPSVPAAAAAPVLLRNLPPGPNDVLRGVSSFVLTSPAGIRVFLDVVAVPPDLEGAVIDPHSLLVVTHRHADHLARRLAERFQGPKLVAEAGMLRSGDVQVEVVPASNDGDEVDGTDHIVVVQVGGLRVVHLGDCGQGALTPAQAARVGKPDVVIGAFEDPNDPGAVRIGKLLSQLGPTVFVPTHLVTPDAVEQLGKFFALQRTTRTELALTPQLLARGRRALLMGANLELGVRAGLPVTADLWPSPPVRLRNLYAKPVQPLLTSNDVNGFVLTSPRGVRVFLDAVFVPPELDPALRDPASLYLATHTDSDHYSRKLVERFAGRKLVAEPGTVESGDVTAFAIPSSHRGDEIDGSDHILVVDLGGFRVVHLGDCGQSALTAAQLERIGRVDVLIGELEDATFEDVRRPFQLVRQLSPAIVIPTHISTVEAVELLGRTHPAVATEREELVLTPALVGGARRSIYLGGDLPLAARAGVPLDRLEAGGTGD